MVISQTYQQVKGMDKDMKVAESGFSVLNMYVEE